MKFPTDIDEAYEQWGANCGPCSIAAILERSVNDIRPFLGDFESRRYMNITHLKNALDSAGVKYRSIGPNLPNYGLVFVQWGGHEAKPIRVQYRFTHTIGYKKTDFGSGVVFEVNADEIVTWELWQRVMPQLVQEEKKGDGSFIIRGALEVFTGPHNQKLSES